MQHLSLCWGRLSVPKALFSYTWSSYRLVSISVCPTALRFHIWLSHSSVFPQLYAHTTLYSMFPHLIVIQAYVSISDCPTALRFQGAGIAQWLERRTRNWKVAGSNPCWNGGRIFFSRVDFLCWLLFRYPFHPRVTTVARKKSRSFCQKCMWQVTAKHAYTLRMWLLLNRASALVTTCP